MTDIVTKMKDIVSEALDIDIDDVTDDLCAKNCSKWDSAKHIEIIVNIEDELGISFTDADIIKMINFGSLVELAIAKTKI